MLTKNLLLPVKLGYLDLCPSLDRFSPDHPQQADGSPPFQVQVSLAGSKHATEPASHQQLADDGFPSVQQDRNRTLRPSQRL
jgi:hypothetical protein